MNLAAATRLAVAGTLYPGVILDGGNDEGRRAYALELARALLCSAGEESRPCGACTHCRRISWASGNETDLYHPDFQVLEKDLKTSTSVEATREFLKAAQVSPFEARGQVFVIARAETLSGEAANALLKSLEEPHLTAPRNFLLLAPSRQDLLSTLRSRCLSIFLGGAEEIDEDEVAGIAAAFGETLAIYARTRSPVYLLTAAHKLAEGATGGWEDPRSAAPWSTAARAVLRSTLEGPPNATWPVSWRRRMLALAEALLDAPRLRLRGIPHLRILEGMVSRELG